MKALTIRERRNLYENLGLSPIEIGDAEAEGLNAPDLEGKNVLRRWLQKNGNKATRKTILGALKECGFNNTVAELQEKWGISD